MANTDKVYVGRSTEAVNKFGETEVRIGFTADDIQKLTDNLNEKGWVNVTLRKSKEGKPYLQVYTATPAATEEKLPF